MQKKKMFLTMLLFTVGLLSPLLSDAATYYVSPTGSVSWPSCTANISPCAVTTGLRNAVAGDVVRFLAGTYHPGDAPTDETPAYNPTNSGTADNYITFMCDTPLACTITDALNAGTLGRSAIGAYQRSYIIWDGFVLDRDRVVNTMASSIAHTDTAHYIVFRNNELIGRDVTGASLNVSLMSFTGQSSDIAVVNNKFHGLTCSGGACVNACNLWVFTADRVNISNNDMTGQNQGICWKNGQNDVAVYYNFFSNTNGTDVLDHAQNTTQNYYIHHNVSISCAPFYRSDDAPGNSTNHDIYNNTSYCARAIPNASFQVGTSGTQQVRDVSIYNNIISVGGSSICGFYYDSPTAAVYPTIIDYNNYYGPCTIWLNKNLSGQIQYSSLAAWQSNSHSPDAHSISTNPLFVNAGGTTAADYMLTSGSPARRVGRNGEDLGAFTDSSLVIGYRATGLNTTQLSLTSSGSTTTSPPAPPRNLKVQ